MANALMKMADQLGVVLHASRMPISWARFMWRSIVMLGTCALKCIRSMTRRRKRLTGKYRPLEFAFCVPNICVRFPNTARVDGGCAVSEPPAHSGGRLHRLDETSLRISPLA